MKKYIMGILMFIMPSVVYGQNCATPPSCETLGYTKTAADCSGKTILKCPFDNNKVYCDDAAGTARPKAGDIYYSDGSFSSDVIAGKTPIGVVGFVRGKNGLIVALEEKLVQWQKKEGTAVNCPKATDDNYKLDFNGDVISACIARVCQDCEAVEYCNSFSTAGTSAGDWFLPSEGEIRFYAANFDKINAGLKKLSKTLLQESYQSGIYPEEYYKSFYWESSINSNKYYAYSFFMPSGGGNSIGKEMNAKARCVMLF